jgi:hypothetical protein
MQGAGIRLAQRYSLALCATIIRTVFLRLAAEALGDGASVNHSRKAVRYSACDAQQLSPRPEGHRGRKGRIRSSQLLRRRCARHGHTLDTIRPDSSLQSYS